VERQPSPEISRSEAVRVTTLPNGLRVVSETMPGLATAALGVWSGAGSRHESAEEQGLAHLLEHMAFKGTSRRSALQIAEEIEAVGGEVNAETNTEYTAYYSRVLGADTPLALDILSDILTDPAFDPTELKREKGVILQEIGAYEDTPDEVVFDMFMETAYAGAPIGRRILGTPKTVKAQNRASMRHFMDRTYRTPSMVLSAAGAVDHDSIVQEIAHRFDGFDRSAAPPAEAAIYRGGEQRRSRKLEQSHVVFGFKGIGWNDPDHYAMHVFSNLLGGGMSSRLFQEVREKRGLCYEIYSFFSPFSDSGVFAIYGGTGEAELDDFAPLVLDTLVTAAEGPTEAEVSRAKAQMKMSLLTALESPGRRAEQMARHILAYGRVLPREEIVSAIDAITVDDVRRVAHGLLKAAPTLAAIGPVKRLMPYDAVASRIGAPATAPS
jgi:predicted Zn-dependent peptidase